MEFRWKNSILSFLNFWYFYTLTLFSMGGGTSAAPALIPQPGQMRLTEKELVSLPVLPRVYIPSANETGMPDVSLIREQLSTLKAMGFCPGLQETGDKQSADIILVSPSPPWEEPPALLQKESYSLEIKKEGNRSIIYLSAPDSKGFFHAWQTLTSLLTQGKKADGYTLPVLSIQDMPRFAWRGLHLDVSRHFFNTGTVEKMLDTMALFKFNTLHLHLTDGPGWRLEIKKYPELTNTGAWRVDKRKDDWNWPDTELVTKGETRPVYGGYFTQDDIRHLIEYAQKRNVMIVPEIDLPGHSYAALFVYRNLACEGNNVPVDGLKGKDVLCVGNPETREFVRNVLDELVALFPPDTPIHIGGDEVEKTVWLNCPKCRERMKKEGLKNGEELQSSFIRETRDYLKEKGREVIAWDEVFKEGIRENCTIMSWHDDALGIKVAEAGCPVILSPTSHLYLDYYQGDPKTEPPAIGGYIPLEKVFRYHPAEGITAASCKNVRGIQGNLWAEYIKTPQHLEYMTWPRGIALAERAWNPSSDNYPGFLARLSPYLELLNKKKVHYRPLDKVEEQANSPLSNKK